MPRVVTLCLFLSALLIVPLYSGLIKDIPYNVEEYSGNVALYRMDAGNSLWRHTFIDLSGDIGRLQINAGLFAYSWTGSRWSGSWLPFGVGFTAYRSPKSCLDANTTFYVINESGPEFGESALKFKYNLIPLETSDGDEVSFYTELSAGYRYFFGSEYQSKNTLFVSLGIAFGGFFAEDFTERERQKVINKNVRFACNDNSLATWTEFLAMYPQDTVSFTELEANEAIANGSKQELADFYGSYADQQRLFFIYSRYNQNSLNKYNPAVTSVLEDFCRQDWIHADALNTRAGYAAFSSKWHDSPYSELVAARLARIDELEDHDKAVLADTYTEYENFIAKHPGSQFVTEMRARIPLLAISKWDKARLSQNPADYLAYLEANPKGMNIKSATDSLTVLSGYLWNIALKTHKAADFQKCLTAYPKGAHAKAASDSLAAIATRAKVEFYRIETLEKQMMDEIKIKGAGNRFIFTVPSSTLQGGTYCLVSDPNSASVITRQCLYPGDFIMSSGQTSSVPKPRTQLVENYDVHRIKGTVNYSSSLTIIGEGGDTDLLTFVYVNGSYVYLRGTGRVVQDGSKVTELGK
jgi:hypothetical protein